MTLIALASLVAFAASAGAQTTNNSEPANTAPVQTVLMSTQKIIVTSASSHKVCGYLASDAKKTPICDPLDTNLEKPRGLYDHVVASDIATCAHDKIENDWQCWGFGETNSPIDFNALKGAKTSDVFGFGENICRKTNEGLITCLTTTPWIQGPYGLDVVNPIRLPRQFGPFRDLKDVSVNAQGLCVISGDDVRCQVKGQATPLPNNAKFSHPRLVSISTAAICVIDDDGLKCWMQDPDDTRVIRPHSEWRSALSLRADPNGVCVVLPDATTACDRPLLNELNAVNSWQLMPKSLSQVTEYEVNELNACVRFTNRTVRCWGQISKTYGVPPALRQALDISVSKQHVCATDVSGEVVCWGMNSHGQLSQPLKAGGAISYAVSDDMFCRWNKTGPSCAGLTYYSQLTNLPVFNQIVSMALPLADSLSDACAIDQASDDSTKIVCWGNEPSVLAVPITLKNPSLIATSGHDSCANSSDGSIQCWGSSSIGNAPNAARRPRKLVVGSKAACAVDDFGLMCWGPQMAEGSALKVPDSLSMDGEVTDIALGTAQACALTFDHKVVCWGEGKTDVPDLKNPLAVTSIGGATFCATDDDGVKCWGQINVLSGTRSQVPANQAGSEGESLP